jgi:hypothetical protein
MDSNFICYVIYFTVQYSCGKHRNPGARKLSIIYGCRRSFLAAAKVVDGDDHCVCLRPSFCSAWNVNTSSNLDFALLCLFCTYREPLSRHGLPWQKSKCSYSFQSHRHHHLEKKPVYNMLVFFLIF